VFTNTKPYILCNCWQLQTGGLAYNNLHAHIHATILFQSMCHLALGSPCTRWNSVSDSLPLPHWQSMCHLALGSPCTRWNSVSDSLPLPHWQLTVSLWLQYCSEGIRHVRSIKVVLHISLPKRISKGLTPKVLWWFEAQNCLITPILKSSYSYYFFEFFYWIHS
jgi:hypothetical protein